MNTRDVVSLVFLTAAGLLGTVPAAGQSPDPGVTPVRLMDRPEIRISRVDVQPGAVRGVHRHDDVKFHVWLALTGKLEVTIGSAKPVLAAEGQAFFMQKGTPHGFRNVGTTTAAVMEIFVKTDVASTAEIGTDIAIGTVLAALGTQASHPDSTNMFAPVSQSLAEEAGVATEKPVPDVATGPGEPALTLVPIVGPAGQDFRGRSDSTHGGEAAQRAVDRQGFGNARDARIPRRIRDRLRHELPRRSADRHRDALMILQVY